MMTDEKSCCLTSLRDCQWPYREATHASVLGTLGKVVNLEDFFHLVFIVLFVCWLSHLCIMLKSYWHIRSLQPLDSDLGIY